jgi:HlyD family secretion protein
MILKYSFLLKNILVISLFISLFSCAKKDTIINPIEESITHSVYASGTIKSRSQYDVFTKVNGIVEEIYVTEGQLIKKGQPILKLNNSNAALSYENAKIAANYNSIQSNLEKLQQAKTELEVAKLKMDNESSLLERQKKMWAQEIGTKNELDQRELSYKSAVSLFHASTLKLDDLKKQLEFQTEQSSKNVAITAVNMNDFIVKSQIAGKVYSINKEKGEMASTQTAVAIIGDAENFYIELQIDEFDIAKVKAGQKVLVSMDSYKGQSFEAIIDKVYPIMNERSKSFKADASFKKVPKNIFPNLSAETNIIIEVKPNVITIPRSYLVEDKYVILTNKEKRKVVTGLMDYEKVEIISGITVKDQLVKP